MEINCCFLKHFQWQACGFRVRALWPPARTCAQLCTLNQGPPSLPQLHQGPIHPHSVVTTPGGPPQEPDPACPSRPCDLLTSFPDQVGVSLRSHLRGSPRCSGRVGRREWEGGAARQPPPPAALLEPPSQPCRDQPARPGSVGETLPTLAGTGSWGFPRSAPGLPI